MDTVGYRSSCIMFRFFFSESESDTDSVRYPFLHPVFIPQAFGRSVEQILSTSFALDSRGAIRANTERLITETLKEKHSVSPAFSNAAIHLSVILFLSEVRTGFPHTT